MVHNNLDTLYLYPVQCPAWPALDCLETTSSAALGNPGRIKQNKHNRQQQTNVVLSMEFMSLLTMSLAVMLKETQNIYHILSVKAVPVVGGVVVVLLALLGLGDNLAVGDGIFDLLVRDKLALLGHLLHPLALRVLRQAVVGNLGL